MIKIINIVGARPNFMKIAPLMAAMNKHPNIEPLLLHTGQHYDDKLSDIFFTELGIPRPDINLEIGSASRLEQIEKISEAFEPVIVKEKPDAILVVGDVNSTIACARVARKHGVTIIHVEAGLRSFDRDMPEEVNRVETDEISDYLFVTEQSGMENLEKESVPGKRYLVGNVMIDTLAHNLDKALATTIAADLGLEDGSYLVSTFHRPSNVDSKETLAGVIDTLEALSARAPVVIPLHPRTRHSAQSHGLMSRLENMPNLHLTDPLGYIDFLGLIARARAVVTDSGGIQEETTWLGVPCLTMRPSTERPVTCEVGTNTLLGNDLDAVVGMVDAIIDGSYKEGKRPPMWDGHAAERIVDIVNQELS